MRRRTKDSHTRRSLAQALNQLSCHIPATPVYCATSRGEQTHKDLLAVGVDTAFEAQSLFEVYATEPEGQCMEQRQACRASVDCEQLIV